MENRAIVPLEYVGSPNRVRKQWARRVFFATILLCAAMSAYRYGPAEWRQLRRCYWQRECMNFSPPVGTIVFRKGTTLQPALPNVRGYAVTIGSIFVFRGQKATASAVPDCWSKLLAIPGNMIYVDADLAIAFCHERVSRGGHRRLVVIDYKDPFIGDWFASYGMRCAVLSPMSIWKEDSPLVLPLAHCSSATGPPAIEAPSQIEAGQPDPQDASHFTIAYQWADGVRGIVDGWLQEDDTLKLSVRPGPGDLDSENRRQFPERYPTP